MENENIYTVTGGPLKPHEYVQVKTELSARDESWIADHLVRGKATDFGSDQSQFLLGAAQMATLKRAIVGWQLNRVTKTPDGRTISTPIPFSTEAIEDLPGRIYRYIVTKYAELTADEGEESDGDFTSAADGGSEGNSAAMNSTPQKP